MNPVEVKEKLSAVLSQIQSSSGLKCPPLTGETKPIRDLPEFDSKVWPVAITLLSIETNVSIPNDVNIFVNENTKLPSSIDETVGFVCAIAAKQNQKELGAS